MGSRGCAPTAPCRRARVLHPPHTRLTPARRPAPEIHTHTRPTRKSRQHMPSCAAAESSSLCFVCGMSSCLWYTTSWPRLKDTRSWIGFVGFCSECPFVGEAVAGGTRGVLRIARGYILTEAMTYSFFLMSAGPAREKSRRGTLSCKK